MIFEHASTPRISCLHLLRRILVNSQATVSLSLSVPCSRARSSKNAPMRRSSGSCWKLCSCLARPLLPTADPHLMCSPPRQVPLAVPTMQALGAQLHMLSMSSLPVRVHSMQALLRSPPSPTLSHALHVNNSCAAARHRCCSRQCIGFPACKHGRGASSASGASLAGE